MNAEMLAIAYEMAKNTAPTTETPTRVMERALIYVRLLEFAENAGAKNFDYRKIIWTFNRVVAAVCKVIEDLPA